MTNLRCSQNIYNPERSLQVISVEPVGQKIALNQFTATRAAQTLLSLLKCGLKSKFLLSKPYVRGLHV